MSRVAADNIDILASIQYQPLVSRYIIINQQVNSLGWLISIRLISYFLYIFTLIYLHLQLYSNMSVNFHI